MNQKNDASRQQADDHYELRFSPTNGHDLVSEAAL